MCENVYGACEGTSPDLHAASANYDDVKACYDMATHGDTINIPACAEGDCIWSTTLEMNKDVKLIGAGKEATYITNSMTTGYSAIFYFNIGSYSNSDCITTRNNTDSLADDTNDIEISNMTLTGSLSYNSFLLRFGNVTTPVIRRVKVHDMAFKNSMMSLYSYGHIYGVVYNCTFNDARGPKVAGFGRTGFDNDRMAIGDAKGWYVEDNEYTFTTAGVGYVASGANDGGGLIARYNTGAGTLSGGSGLYETHGGTTAGSSAGQKTEVYGNNMTVTGYGNAGAVRGGKAVYMYNLAAAGLYSTYYENNDEIIWKGMNLSEAPATWCTSYNNDGVHRQTCLDSCICQKPHDIYVFNNRHTVNGSNLSMTIGTMGSCGDIIWDLYQQGICTASNPRQVEENKEFFNFVSSGFDGSAGVGCGTIAQRDAITPATTGVGFWVPTNIETMPCDSISSDNIGKNPSVPIAGTLYKWNGSAWVAFWSPYIYPHPLRNESAADTTAPAAPSGLTVN
ncbi:MAG: hypothetical protein PHQ46_09290 [Negativicutes bacterium]|nr:hypothetical protein [Negativicutes bacterium]